MKQRLKFMLTTALKLGFAAALVAWLVNSGKLDFRQLHVLISSPLLLLLTIALFFVCSIGLGTLRWWILLRGMEIRVGFARAMQLQSVGLFFNAAMPGAVGGDIIKAVYVIRDQKSIPRTPAMLTILLDRIIGLFGLFTIGAVAALFSLDYMWSTPALRSIVLFICALVFGMLIFYATVFIPFSPGRDPFERLFSMRIPGFGLAKSIYQALRFYRKRPLILIGALVISVVIQLFSLGYFAVLTSAVLQTTPPFGELAAIVPVGMLSYALPIAPGGIGVGHIAFERLYHTIGLAGGANVFNVYCLGNLFLSLVGAIPYVLLKGNGQKTVEGTQVLSQSAPGASIS